MRKSLKLISGGRVLDLAFDLDKPPVMDVLIEGDRILATGEEASRIAAQSERVENIDAAGKLLIPGLINTHYHSHDVLLRGSYEQLPLDIWGLYTHPANYPSLTPQDIRLRTLLGAADALCNGITTLQDMVTIIGSDPIHVESILAGYQKSGARAAIGLQIADAAAVDAVAYWNDLPDGVRRQLPGASDPAGLMGLVERTIEDPSDARVSWVLAPSAPQRCSDALLKWVARLSQDHDLPVFTHVYEARSQVAIARQKYPDGSLLTHLERFGLVNSRLTIAHGVWMEEEEIRRFGAAGGNLAFNPMSNMKLRNGFAPIVAYAEAGVNIGLGCDNCSCNDSQNLFQVMKMFGMFWGFQKQAGESDAARLAFEAATLGGARALGRGHELGAIRAGYLADLVLIDLEAANYRPLNSALRQLVYGESGQNIRAVMVGGEIVVREGKLVGASDSELKEAAEAARARMEAEVLMANVRYQSMMEALLRAYESAEQFSLPYDRFSMRR